MTIKLHCFGVLTPSGQSLRELVQDDLAGYSRKALVDSDGLYFADLNDPAGFQPVGRYEDLALWISFAPIWLLAPFLQYLTTFHPERLQGLRGVVACSSSSTITKRFATNRFDRQLVSKLITAEDQLLATCSRLSVPCLILRPTLIYGKAGSLGDRNLSRLIHTMRRLPLLPLPADTGLRQPIHASQLAAIVLHLARQLHLADRSPSLPERISLGGDTTLTYADMIRALQHAQPFGDPARRCRLLSIPNRLFFLLAAPLLLLLPKAFEAVLRMGANLSGFIPAHQLLGSEPQPFPVLPLG